MVEQVEEQTKQNTLVMWHNMKKLWCIHIGKVLELDDWWEYCPACGYSILNASLHKLENSPYFMKTDKEISKIKAEKDLIIAKKKVKKAIGTDTGVEIIEGHGYYFVVYPNEYRDYLDRKREYSRIHTKEFFSECA